MALVEMESEAVPLDTFRVRIAVVRAVRGWNYEDAAAATGVSAQNWRLWEKTDRKPHDYENTCRAIADGSGISRSWIMSGGPLRSRCLTQFTLLNGPPGQMEFTFHPSPQLVSIT